MRTEYTFTITDSKGKKQACTYPKSLIMEKYLKAKSFYESKGCKVELWKVSYIGNSLHKAEKIEVV